MFVVDANILVYATNLDSPFHDLCDRLIEEWRREAGAWYTTWSIQYEYLRVVTHPRVLPRPLALHEAWRYLSAIHAAPGFSVLVPTGRHAEVAARTFEEVPGLSGNILHDAHIAILMREHGVRRIYSRDTAFHRFPFLEVIDPLMTIEDRRPRKKPGRRSRAPVR